MELTRLEPGDIEIGGARRQCDPAKVATLAESMKEIGMQTPISVWFTADNEHVYLVAGRHRLEAAKLLGWPYISCIVVALDERQRRMWEISENLHRAELTVLERVELEAEWIRLAADKPAQDEPVYSKGGRGKESGINLAARELGIDRTEAQRAVKIDSLAPAAKEKARALRLDNNQTALLKAAREPTPEAQVEALQQHAAPPLPPPQITRRFEALMRAWEDASHEDRELFLERLNLFQRRQ